MVGRHPPPRHPERSEGSRSDSWDDAPSSAHSSSTADCRLPFAVCRSPIAVSFRGTIAISQLAEVPAREETAMGWPNRGLLHRPVVMGRRGVVASAHPLASLAGLRMLMQ